MATLGKEQFTNIITELRNKHISAGIQPLLTFRREVAFNDELKFAGGFDNSTRDHWKKHLVNCDRIRRMVTYNPESIPLGDQIAKAIDPNAVIENGVKPTGGDNLQITSTSLYELPWKFDGSDPNIPLNSGLDIQNTLGFMVLQQLDQCIVNWTRLESRNRSQFLTVNDSFRVYEQYQQLLSYIVDFGGDANMVDIATVLPTDQPQGVTASANVVGEKVTNLNNSAGTT